MKRLFLLFLIFSCPLSSLSQKKSVDDNAALQQLVLQKQIIVDNLEYQVKEIPLAAVRVFVRYKIASWLWKDGKDNSGKAEQIAVRAVDDLYENKDEIPNVYFSILKPDLFTLLDGKSKDAANRLREKHKIRQDDESGNIEASLKQKDGEKLATDLAIQSLTNQPGLRIETLFLLGQLQTRKSPEFFRLLSAVISALETGQVYFNTNDLLMMSAYSTATNVPIEVQKKFFKIVVNKSRNIMQMPDGDINSAYNLLSLIISDISTNFPELHSEAVIIQSILKTRTSQSTIKALERWDRIKNSSDKLSAYISEAEQADNQAVKYDLYVIAAQLALKMGKFKYAVDIIEKTAELKTSKNSSEILQETQERDEFFGQVAEKALNADDPDSANYAIKKMTDVLAKSEGLKKTANYYFEQGDTVSARYSLDDAIKLTVKAENTYRRISSLINLFPAAQKIERNRVSDLSELTAKSINAIPSLNVEDKPQTENYKNYVTLVMNINQDLLPALTSLIKEDRSEAINLANSINKKEIKIIADYALTINSTLQMTRREKEQSKGRD